MSLCSQAEEWLTLYFLPGLGCTLLNKLVHAAGSAQNVLKADEELLHISGIGAATFSLLHNSSLLHGARTRAEQEIAALRQHNISLTSLLCDSYPPLLKEISDPPSLLFYKGDLACLDQSCIAIVGSRNASEYGKKVSAMLAGQLAAKGCTIVSGGAYGIDSSAHRGALKYGKTAAVFGCGLDINYPAQNRKLFDQIMENGVLVSEYSVGTRPEKFRFPARNRIISGLAAGVTIVEATEKSGSLITARLALDQGREVWAVPGRIDSLKSRGSHRLIQTGAQLIQTVDDIFETLNIHTGLASSDTFVIQHHTYSENEQRLLGCLDVYPADIDTLLRVTGFSVNELYALLLELELKGSIRQLPGQLYELNPE